jgi:uncharacterized membrane protein
MMSWLIRRKPGGTPAASSASAEDISSQGRLLPTGRLEAFSDGVFAIAITLLVLELHVPTGQEALLRGLEHEWPRYLGYFVSFAFISGVWIAHSNLTRFIKAADPDLMRLNLMLLLFVSFLPFTTAIAATHLFASNLSLREITISTSTERVAAVVFGLNMTLAALMVYLMLRHVARTPGPRGRRSSAHAPVSTPICCCTSTGSTRRSDSVIGDGTGERYGHTRATGAGDPRKNSPAVLHVSPVSSFACQKNAASATEWACRRSIRSFPSGT